jgi:hypothetical protein
MLRYAPGQKKLTGRRREPGEPKATPLQSKTPPRGRTPKLGWNPNTEELVVTARGRTFRRKMYDS